MWAAIPVMWATPEWRAAINLLRWFCDCGPTHPFLFQRRGFPPDVVPVGIRHLGLINDFLDHRCEVAQTGYRHGGDLVGQQCCVFASAAQPDGVCHLDHGNAAVIQIAGQFLIGSSEPAADARRRTEQFAHLSHIFLRP